MSKAQERSKLNNNVGYMSDEKNVGQLDSVVRIILGMKAMNVSTNKKDKK